METERTVYQVECQLLLSDSVDLDPAQEMLCDPSHLSWRNETISTRFESQLEPLDALLLSTISKIKSKLSEIDEIFKDFIPDTPQLSDVSLPFSHLQS